MAEVLLNQKGTMKRLLQIAVMGLACSASGQGSYEAIQGYSLGAPGFVNGTAGWTFQPLVNLSVVALGCFDYVVTSQGTMDVGLWDSSGTLLASNAVNSSSTLVNQTRYISISPIFLTAGQTYHLGAYSPNGNFTLNADATFTATPNIQVRGSATSPGFASPLEQNGANDLVLLGPNAQFGSVPEPTSTALLGLGLLGLLVRRAFRGA